MNAVAEKSIYQQVVAVTYDYLGPAAQRFIDREIKAHLHKKPQDLTKADVVKLVDWSKLAFALLTEDAKMVDDYAGSLLTIAKKGHK
jgi:nitric oxide reductase activation protein